MLISKINITSEVKFLAIIRLLMIISAYHDRWPAVLQPN